MSLPESGLDRLLPAGRRRRARRGGVLLDARRALGEAGRGEGGDMSYVIDLAAEDAIFAELEALGVPVTAVSEERGEVAIGGGGPTRVVIDPIDGSRQREARPAVRVRLDRGRVRATAMADVEVGWVAELATSGGHAGVTVRDWWAVRGEGAFLAGERLPQLEPGPLEMLGLETARPGLVAAVRRALADLEARRMRALGSVASALPRGGRPARRDGHAAPGPLGGRRRGRSCSCAKAAARWRSRAATRSTSRCARAWRRPARDASWSSGCWAMFWRRLDCRPRAAGNRSRWLA